MLRTFLKQFKHILNLYFDKKYKNWKIDMALRYIPVVNFINNLQLKNQDILEVGSGLFGIIPYLRKNITLLDTNFEIKSPHIKQIVGSVTNLPFNDNDYDIIICMDMLEHIPKHERQNAINEIFRVSKKYAIIGVPCGHKSQYYDNIILNTYKKIYNKSYIWLEEHLKYGLPSLEELNNYFYSSSKQLNKNITIIEKYNVNIYLWYTLRRLFISKNKYLNNIEHPISLIFFPILKYFNFKPCYRVIFI